MLITFCSSPVLPFFCPCEVLHAMAQDVYQAAFEELGVPFRMMATRRIDSVVGGMFSINSTDLRLITTSLECWLERDNYLKMFLAGW